MIKFFINLKNNILITCLAPFLMSLQFCLILIALIMILLLSIWKFFTDEKTARNSKYIKNIEQIFYFFDSIFDNITGK
jgi:hypothetical protein